MQRPSNVLMNERRKGPVCPGVCVCMYEVRTMYLALYHTVPCTIHLPRKRTLNRVQPKQAYIAKNPISSPMPMPMPMRIPTTSARAQSTQRVVPTSFP